MKVVIVGAGIMGLSSAWALKRRGHDVVVLEQGPFPNPLGSSVDDHRVLRRAYGAERGYQAMMVEGLQAWSRLWADIGRSLYIETGILYCGRTADPWLNASAEGLESTGIALDRLTAAETIRRYPVIRPEGIERAVFVPSSGALQAGEIVRGIAAWLKMKGVEVQGHTGVAAVDPLTASVTLADGRKHSGDRLIVAAGPWAPKLLPSLSSRVTPSRQILVYLEPPTDLADAWSRMPVLADLTPEGRVYVIPPARGMRMKIGDHTFSLAGDPDRRREATAEDTESILSLARYRLRDLDRFRMVETKTCFYDVTADERFVAETVERSVVLTGFSGHGFKFGAAIGEKVAAAVAGDIAPDVLASWAAGKCI